MGKYGNEEKSCKSYIDWRNDKSGSARGVLSEMDIGDHHSAEGQVQFSEGQDLEVQKPSIIHFQQVNNQAQALN